MDAQNFNSAVQDLIAKVVGGKALDAFDRYYADDVTMQENDQPPESVRRPVVLSRRTLFLSSRQ
jgi:hypothetical protein